MRALLLGVLLPLTAVLAGSSRSEPAAPRRHLIEMSGFEFKPALIRVAAGDTIVWVNRDVAPHTATSGRQWDTGTIEAKRSGYIVAKGEGEQEYVCVLHRGMTAKIVVR